MAIHIAESELEQQLVVDAEGAFADGLRRRGIGVERRGSSPIELLERLGVLDARPLLIHCVRAEADDVARIASSRSAVAHCPASNAKLGHGVAPLDELLAAGIAVGLGSDSMASNNRMDLLEEARLALFSQRVRLRSHGMPTAADVLELATIGGASALGLGDVTGSLDVGKQADLAAFGLDGVGPTQDPVEAAVFSLTGARTRFVCVAGKPLVRDGRLVSPREGLADRLRDLGDALAGWLEAGGEMRGVV
jgi:5-methylthioadenosine/S-adenosylhomocysteine deaminase